MKAAWRVVAANKDFNGNGYYQTTFFKFDAAWVYPWYWNFDADFNTYYAGGFYPDSYFINIMPVFQTSGIAPNLYGTEYNMRAAVEGYVDQPASVGIEVNLKQNPGILTTLTNWVYYNTPKALGNFNPYAEWIDPNDPYQTYQFFYSNGYCCAVPRNWFYNGAPNGQPSDTNDLRTEWPFLLDQGNGFNIITTDNVLPMAHYLWNEGKRNQSYLQ